ncbi:hypothetical protein ACFC18_50065 [Streptomyces sp. NPDC056121]|uniref:hypothetical protein n=1 Tax=Streptomyces sp. NPDC056121 TaxID=3345718 RepID=UPI0035D548A4
MPDSLGTRPRVDDASEGALFELIGELNALDSTFVAFVVIRQPYPDDLAWFASGAVLSESGYGYANARRDTSRREHRVTTETRLDQIAGDLTIWTATRTF